MEDESVTDSEPEESDSEVMQRNLTMIRLKKKFFKLKEIEYKNEQEMFEKHKRPLAQNSKGLNICNKAQTGGSTN